MRRALILALALALPGTLSAETRCGWFANPTPANFVLTDAHDSWWLAAQGTSGAPGFYDALEAGGWPSEWVAVNGSYGFGCACVEGEFGPIGTGDVLRITRMEPLPLSRCEADPAIQPGPFGN